MSADSHLRETKKGREGWKKAFDSSQLFYWLATVLTRENS